MFVFLFGSNQNIRFTEYFLEFKYNLKLGSLHNKFKIISHHNLEKNSITTHGLETDIVLEFIDGTIINLEAYSNNFYKGSRIKSLFYICNLFSNQLKIKESYLNSKKHIQINIVEGTSESTIYKLISIEDINEEYLEDKFEIEVLNLDKIENKYYNKNIKLKRLLKFLKAKTREEAIKISKGDEKLMQMMSTMEMYVNDERTKSYFNRERHLEARKHDYEYGIKLKTAKNLLNTTLTIKEIASATGLPINVIEKLKLNE